MGQLICSVCKNKKSKLSIRAWYKCSRHGVICPSCKAGSLITKDKCPKCGNELKLITT